VVIRHGISGGDALPIGHETLPYQVLQETAQRILK
jgi:hypothetical protein